MRWGHAVLIIAMLDAIALLVASKRVAIPLWLAWTPPVLVCVSCFLADYSL